MTAEITGPAYILDTLRTYSAGSKLFSVKNNGTECFYVDGDGSLKGATFDGAVIVSTGGLTVTAGGLTVAATGIVVQAGGIDIEDTATFRDTIAIGPVGNADCNLYRNSANVLKTDDSLTVAGTLTSAGYTMFLSPPEISVTSSTITLPASGTVFFLNAGSAQNPTTISGGTAGQIVAFIAKTGTAAITFTSGGNISVRGSWSGILDDNTGAGNTSGIIFVFDGSVWYPLGNSRNG